MICYVFVCFFVWTLTMILIGPLDQLCYDCHWIRDRYFLTNYCFNFYRFQRHVLMGERVRGLSILKDRAKLIYKRGTFCLSTYNEREHLEGSLISTFSQLVAIFTLYNFLASLVDLKWNLINFKISVSLFIRSAGPIFTCNGKTCFSVNCLFIAFTFPPLSLLKKTLWFWNNLGLIGATCRTSLVMLILLAGFRWCLPGFVTAILLFSPLKWINILEREILLFFYQKKRLYLFI